MAATWRSVSNWHSSNEPGEFSQWYGHDDSARNIVNLSLALFIWPFLFHGLSVFCVVHTGKLFRENK